MHGKAATIFYGLASFVLSTALFAVANPATPEVASLQENIQHNFKVALIQTIGDQPVFDNLELIWDSTASFYEQMADNSLAMIQDPGSDRDIAMIYKQVYQNFASAFTQHPATTAEVEPEITVGANFMTQEAVYNIVPPIKASYTEGAVAGVSIEPVNERLPWVTMRDNMTNQLYCVALYNGEVNKYLGTCKNEYH